MSQGLNSAIRLMDSHTILNALQEAAAKLEAVERAKSEPIAVIGLSCRFPGGANDPDSFWHLLHEGRDAIVDIPSSRWDIDRYFDADPDAPGKMYVRQGGFIDDVDSFDPEFFGIAPREAVSMDPQQRLLLEVAWEALERARLVPERLSESRTGVFVGITNNDYARRLTRGGDLAHIDAYYGSGNTLNACAGRLSFYLGLQGPSLAVDTACSSSLVAVHLACQSLRGKECDLALVGGVNLILCPDASVALCRARMLSPDGRCKTFDASANGYVRGEGCGVVVLKRLTDARAAGDRILALIRGSAVNQDGPSSGFTVPHGPSQQMLIREALAQAKLDPVQINYLEAHGTGTSLGDPIEVQAAAAVLGAGRVPDHPLLIGSVKTNVGHLESAAGMAGFMKAVLALECGVIPPHLHFHTPNPHIPWADLPVAVTTSRMPWPSSAGERYAAVSSFGASGTNAHVILQDVPRTARSPIESNRPVHLLTLSARTEQALRQLAGRYAEAFEVDSALDIGDVAFSVHTTRSHMRHRLAVPVETATDACRCLRGFCHGKQDDAVLTGKAKSSRPPKLAFLLTGQGSQYAGMGRDLFLSQPVFHETIERCNAALKSSLDRSLVSILYSDSQSLIDETGYTQPVLFAFEMALAELWKSWGIQPDWVMGHSLGEYTAACLAGVFTLEDGLKLVAARARLMQALPHDGGMVAVLADEERVSAAIQPFRRDVSIAAINGPQSVVISGARCRVETVVRSLEALNIVCKPLNVSHAFHSPLMQSMVAEYERVVRDIEFHAPRKALISNLTGQKVGEETKTPRYWIDHILQPVRFHAGMVTLDRAGCDVFLEIGPKPVLLGMGRQCLPQSESVWLPSLREGQNDWNQLFQSLAALYVRGAEVNWEGVNRGFQFNRVDLPTYPWQRQRYWLHSSLDDAPQRGDGVVNDRSPILELIQQGETDKLVTELQNWANWTDSEYALMPKVLTSLVELHRRSTREERYRDWLYEVQWKPRPRKGRELSPSFLPAPRELLETLGPHVERVSASPDWDNYKWTLNRLERLSVSAILRALQNLSLRFFVDQPFNLAEFGERAGVIPQYRRLWSRMFDILAEESIVKQSGDSCSFLRVPDPEDIRSELDLLRENCPEAVAEITLFERCGERLADVLRGKCDPLSLLFPEGNALTAAELYQNAPGAVMMNELVRIAVERVVERLPHDRLLRVLEIGAGTGGTTAWLLPVLPKNRTEYTFTDLSQSFLHQAQEKFKDYPFVDYRILDIETDPETHGFSLGSFDVIVATNVLHATRDVRRTLNHTRRLAAPGGMLLLVEGVGRLRFIDLIFGLTEGWWRFADTLLRNSHPLLSVHQWLEVLKSLEFSAVEGVAASPRTGDVLAKQALLIAQTSPRQVTESALIGKKQWLVFSDRQGVGAELERLLINHHAACTLVRCGNQYQKIASNEYEIDPHSPPDFVRLLADIQDDVSSLSGIVYLWGLDAPEIDSLESEVLESALKTVVGGALHLIQAMMKSTWREMPSLWLVTRNAVPCTETESVPGFIQSPLWGMGKVIALEHPDIHSVLVDLDSLVPSLQAQSLFDEIRCESTDRLVACRTHGRFVARLARKEITPVKDEPSDRSIPFILPKHGIRFRDDCSYLITGGLGGLGLVLARWMVERGAKHLVLMGRHEPNAEVLAKLQSLMDLGACLSVKCGDVSCGDRMASILSEIAQTPYPLVGVIHAAGVLDDGVLLHQTWDRFAAVFTPKVFGAWNLHRLTRDLPLEVFVLFSTATSLLGSPGQANHAAANTFLDVLAFDRRARGLPALSVNWGPWESIGAAAQRNVGQRLGLKGIGTIEPYAGLSAFEHLMAQSSPQVGVIPIDWPQLLSSMVDVSFFENFKTVQTSVEQVPLDLLQELLSAPPNKQRTLCMAHVRRLVATVLGVADPERLDPQQGFFDVGMDSLTSMELRNRLQTTLHCTLPATVVFDYPTVETLSDYLLAGLGHRPKSEKLQNEPMEKQSEPAWDDSSLDELSMDELGALLDEELGKLEERQDR